MADEPSKGFGFRKGRDNGESEAMKQMDETSCLQPGHQADSRSLLSGHGGAYSRRELKACLQKKTINEVSGKDEMRIQSKPFEPEETEWKDNQTLPFPNNSYIIDLHRKVSKDNIKNIKKMELMPGLRIKWKRNGNNHNELYPKYQQEENEYMKEFVR